ncbi:MAG: PEGA domain-containing protein [Elusimicrobiota bacterium]|nr:PEGA domain-containing protein [Elusimicrobiota bacterium]
MMMNVMRRLVLPAALFAVSGCASIVSGSTQTVTFQSHPEGASVTVDGTPLGKTPLSMTLKKGKYKSVTFEKDGYKRLVMPMGSRMDGWFWGNILIGGLLGSTTDGVSGAAHEYSPGQYMVSLEPLNASRMESDVNKDARQKAREFLIIGYRNLIGDIAKGKGEYLQSAYGVLGVPKEEQGEALKKLRALSEAYADIPEFVDRAIALFMKEGAAVTTPPERPWSEVSGAAVEEKYAFLAAMPLSRAQAIVQSLDVSDRKAIAGYALKHKGTTGAMSWSFVPEPKLGPEERGLVVWLVSSYTEYKP